MARLYRLALDGRIRSDEMTRSIYALKEIRASLEAELLTDVQQRLVLLSREMDNHNGHRVPFCSCSTSICNTAHAGADADLVASSPRSTAAQIAASSS
jgi:hypothetical protein